MSTYEAVPNPESMVRADVIVIGAGTAGCVLASRLSEDPALSVLLIEAGDDFDSRDEPLLREPFPVAHTDSRFLWPDVDASIAASQPAHGIPQGRGVGGSSNVMGMVALRGLPADFDRWQLAGAEGWDWQGVAPYFARSERDLDCAGSDHGDCGPIPVRRLSRARWAGFSEGFARAAEQGGVSWCDDINAQVDEAVAATPMSNLMERRISVADAYLTPAVRGRANLRLLTNTEAERIEVHDGQVIGVHAIKDGRTMRFAAKEVVLCAGALHTPALLMRSGIGAVPELESMGIEVVSDVPGVGRHLLNHPALAVAFYLPPGARQRKDIRPAGASMLRYSSGYPGCEPGDMVIVPASRTALHPLGRRVGYANVCVYGAYSEGTVRLRSTDPGASPEVKMNMLSDPRDLERLVGGVRRLGALLASPELRGLRAEVFLPPERMVAALARPSKLNTLLGGMLSGLLGLGGWARRIGLGFSAELLKPERLRDDEAFVRELVLRRMSPTFHLCGTAKMGAVDDPEAVVDPRLRVKGIDGLRVADASVMPSSVSGNTHMPVVMIGEKAAALIAEDLAGAAAGTTRPAETVSERGSDGDEL